MPDPEFIVNRTALIDADFIAYQLAAWAHSNQASTEEMAERIEETFADWMRRSCCTQSIACFSCSREDNFRKDAYPLYKSNRQSTPPAMLPTAKKLVSRASDRTVTLDRLEADDIMGILSTNGKVSNPVIITVDKDLRQIPGWHFNPDKEDFPVEIRKAEGDYLFYQQWLTGDSVDGFGGIKGMGPKRAHKVLAGTPSDGATDVMYDDPSLDLEHLVLAAYRDAGASLDEAVAQARCARILRAEDFDADNRQVIPWEPNEAVLANVGIALPEEAVSA